VKLIFKIAWRNILRHKGKSVIIGIILFLGSLLMTIGNGVISGMDRGLEKNIIEGFMGDIVIISGREKNDNVLFKIMGESVESITTYGNIKEVLSDEKTIKGFLPVGKNVTMILNEDEGDPGYTMVLGVDFDRYYEFFPDNFTIIEGKKASTGERAILIPRRARDEIYNMMDLWLTPENTVLNRDNLSKDASENSSDLRIKNSPVFMGLSEDGVASDLRVPVRGIISFKALNSIWGNFSIIDIESYRQCLGYFTAADSKTEISKAYEEKISAKDVEIKDRKSAGYWKY